MIKFKRTIGPAGIPIYHQRMPQAVKSLALNWVVFAGSADDSLVGADGAYHWFEHVPFRGTVRYPDGYADTKGRFTRLCASTGAWTNTHCTCYWTTVPVDYLADGLEVITDLWSQPLLRDQDILSEKKIIFEEIRRKLATAQGKSQYMIEDILMPDHPHSHPTLGSEESLSTMSPETLRRAHSLGYDRSRVALIVSGNVTISEILRAVEKQLEFMPDNGLSERRTHASYGKLPKWNGGTTETEWGFTSSIVQTLYPVVETSVRERIIWRFLANLASFGGLDSPLYRIVREERNLAYATQPSLRLTSDGGYWGFQMETGTKNIEAARQSFMDLLEDKSLRSLKRFEIVKSGYLYSEIMQDISPTVFNRQAIMRMQGLGELINDNQWMSTIQSLRHEEVLEYLDRLMPDDARTVVFRGTDKAA